MGNVSVILPAAVVVVLVIVAAVVVIKAQDKLDYERIAEDVEDRGGKVVKIVSDWSGESDERCYKSLTQRRRANSSALPAKPA